MSKASANNSDSQDWETKLNRNEQSVIITLFRHLHGQFDKIFPNKSKMETLKALFKERGDNESYYNNYYTKALKGNIKGAKEIAINCIIYIYCKVGKTILEFEKDSDRIIGSIIDGRLYYLEDNNNQDNKANLLYLFYYWKNNNEYKTNERLNLGKLDIKPDWSEATLRFNSFSDPNNFLKGTVKKGKSAAGGEVVTINLREGGLDNSVKALTMVIVFYLHSSESLQNNIWVSYVKENKQARGNLSNGFGYLEKVTKEDWEKPYINIKEREDLYYLLSGKRQSIPNISENDTDGTNFYKLIEDKIIRYHGVYEGNLIHLDRASSIVKFLLVFRKNGSVIIYTPHSTTYPKVYSGSGRIQRQGGRTFVIFDFDFNIKSERIFQNGEGNSFRFVVHEDSSIQSNSEIIYLFGVRIGIRLHNSGINPISSKVVLKSVSYKSNLNDFFQKPDGNLEVLSLLSQLRNISISDENSVINHLLFDSLTDLDFRRFIVSNKSKFNEPLYYTDSSILEKLKKAFPDENELIPIQGHFDCFCFTLRNDERLFDHKPEDAVIIKYPIYIEHNGIVKIRVTNDIHVGRAYYNRPTNHLFISFPKDFLLSAIFKIPKTEEKDNTHKGIFSGVLVKVHTDGEKSEGRIAVLIKNKEISFDKNTYNSNIQFGSLLFNRIDKETHGALSHLTGPVNRIIRAESEIDDQFFHRTNNSLKCDLFYSACYLAQQTHQKDYIKEAKARLVQAYIAGFGQTYFRGEEVDKSNSKDFRQLRNERDELRKAISEKGPLSEAELKKYVEEFWFTPKGDDSLKKLFGVDVEVDSLILRPEFSFSNKGGGARLLAESDKYAIGAIKDLFDHNSIQSPQVTNSQNYALNTNSTLIAVGLYSNNFTMLINSYESEKHGRYFKIVEDEDTERQHHSIWIASVNKKIINFDENKWSFHQLGKNSKFKDYAIFTNLKYSDTQRAIVCGGLTELGTKKIGEYLISSWSDILYHKDEETGITVMNSDCFCCLFGITQDEMIIPLTTRAY